MDELIKAIELATKSVVDANENELTVVELSDLEWIMEDYHQSKLKLLNLQNDAFEKGYKAAIGNLIACYKDVFD